MKTQKPDFNRLLSMLQRTAIPDRVPMIELHIDIEIMDAFMGQPVRTVKDYARFWREAGYDHAMLYVRGQPLPDHRHQFKIGQLFADENENGAARSTFDVTMGVKDEKTFETYPWITPQDVYYADVDSIKDFLDDGMKLIVNQGPIFSGTWRAMGMEAFSFACMDNIDLVKAVADKLGNLSVNIIENLLQREWVGAIWLGDDLAYTTSLMVAPDFLRKYIFPYYQQIGDLCQKYRKPFIFHSDGNITAVLDDLISCGVTAVHPNEPSSVDIVELKNKYSNQLSFLSGMDVDMMASGTTQQITQRVKYLIENVAPSGGFAISGGNSIPKYVPLENYKTLLRTAKEYGCIYTQ